MQLILTDADGFRAASESSISLVVVSFSHREVVSGQVGDACDRLLHLTDDPVQTAR